MKNIQLLIVTMFFGLLTSGCVPAEKLTSITLKSDAGDYIGQGNSYQYTQENALITVAANNGKVSVRIEGDESWGATFQAPDSFNKMQLGLYSGLMRYPFHNPVKGGLSWSGEGRGCNELIGWFLVDKITYEDSAVTELELSFEQYCDNSEGALHGEVKWYKSDTTMPPGPIKI